MYFGVSQAQIAVNQAVVAQQQGETQRVVDEMGNFTALNDRVPAHAIELTEGQTLSALDLLALVR